MGWVFGSYLNVLTFAPTFTNQSTRKMTKKFALLATMAALFVACSSSTEETMENAAETTTEAVEATTEAVEAAPAAVEAAVDTAAAAVEAATEAAPAH